jgi:nuclease S1
MLRIAIALLFVLASPEAAGWAKFGHRLIGELAERQLSPAAREEVSRLLAGEPDPTLGGVASWADDMRDLDGWKWTAPLHYVRIHDPQCHFDAQRDCADGACVVGAIERYSRELADRSLPSTKRAEALKFVVHFVGDIHQPLHAGQRPDEGGNKFQISVARGGYNTLGKADGADASREATNLHSVWDFHVLASAQRDDAQWLAVLGEPLVLAPQPVATWAEASCRLTNGDSFYPRRPGKLAADYLDTHRALAERQLREAATRLAAIIEPALAPR